MYKCPDVTCKETVMNYDSNNQQSIKWKVRYGTSHTSTPQGTRDDPNTVGMNNKRKKKKTQMTSLVETQYTTNRITASEWNTTNGQSNYPHVEHNEWTK